MKRIAALTCVLILTAAPVRAQDALLQSCATVPVIATPGPAPAQIQDQFRFLCGQVVQGMSAVQPTVGVAFSGGAHTLGTATNLGLRLGTVPRISLTARVNAALADVPDLLDGYTPTFDDQDRLRPMGTVGVPVLALQADAVVGLYNGLSRGPLVRGLGAVDLLGSVSFIPAAGRIGLDETIVNVGAGARVGLMRQGLIRPGVSVSAMYRTMLGDVAFGEIDPGPAGGDAAEFSAGLSTWSFRAGASKGLLLFDLAAGVGYDIYTSDVRFDWRLDCPADVCEGQEMTLTTDGGVQGQLRTAAWNVFGNVGLRFLLVRAVAEVGYQQPRDIVDLAAIQAAGLPAQAPSVEDLTAGRFFLGLGVRLSF